MADASQSDRLNFLSKIGLILSALAMVLSLLGGWIASTRPVAAIDQTKLKNYQKSLQSYAAEALYLANQYKAQRPTGNYTKVSFDKLFQAASDVSDKLHEEEPEANLDQAVKDTADQADQLDDSLSQLSQLPGPGQVSDLISQLSDIKQQLEEAIAAS